MPQLTATKPLEYGKEPIGTAQFLDELTTTTKNTSRIAKLAETVLELLSMATGSEALYNASQVCNTFRGVANPAYRLTDATNRWVNRKGFYEVVHSEGSAQPRLEMQRGLAFLSIASPLLLFVATTLGLVKFLHRKKIINIGGQYPALLNALRYIATPGEAVASATEFALAFYYGKQKMQIDHEIHRLTEAMAREANPVEQQKITFRIRELTNISNKCANREFEKILGGIKYALDCLGGFIHRGSVPRARQCIYDLLPRTIGLAQSVLALQSDGRFRQEERRILADKARVEALAVRA